MSIENQIREFVLKNYLFTDDPTMLRDDESFMKKGIIDSTGVLEVIEFLRTEFDIRVEDDEMVPENLDSVRQLAAFVTRKRAAT